MTYEDVDRACAVLEQAGRTPSGNTVLAHLKARGLPASKRTVLKYLKLRQPAPATGLTTATYDDPVSHVAPADAAHQQQQATWARFAAHRQQQARPAAPPWQGQGFVRLRHGIRDPAGWAYLTRKQGQKTDL